jgi:indole-3-glycerol phosphate synthase
MARGAVSLPVLRKDFVLSTYQVYETAALGADAMLLIVRAVPFEFLRDGIALARELGMDVLVETHSAPEVERAIEAGAVIVGINNRDLATFRTDIRKSAELASLLGPGQVAVAESGVSGRADIETLMDAGIRSFLIGESLVRADDPKERLRDFVGAEGPLR